MDPWCPVDLVQVRTRALMHARTQKTTAHWSFTQEPYELKLEKAWASCHELVPLVPHPPLGTLQ